ncbi:15047_t:CDS:2 [Racocetra fulgida]|uniref:15047_t:CDS:1 n=1 Tax=Racocetra fulgida TaxID=60492 RepID=A0A9N9C8C6_9GLOM|nr:15047_t:CDS:2 [Racocetra fulgida]
MGLGQSKNTSINDSNKFDTNIKPDTKFVTNKTERRKKFRSLSALTLSRGNGNNEIWNFSNGKRFHHNSLRISKISDTIIDEERLQRRHQLFKRIWQTNFSAPVDETLTAGGARVLEIGSYQSSMFTGVDKMPLFPQEKKPENAKFLQANVLNGLPFLDDTFDFVYMGLLVTAFTAIEWEKVIPEIVRVTKQGGWIEFMESDFQYYNEGPTTARLTDSCIQDYDFREFVVMSKIIIKKFVYGAVKLFMKSKGIIGPLDLYILKTMETNERIDKNIKTDERSCFVGKWAGELGQLAVEDITKGWITVKSPMSKLMKIKSREYDEIIATFAKEVEQHKTYFKNWRFFGQKIVATSASNITTPSWYQ